ncbi:MAG: hypothetical protein QM606_01205 [Leucobacter sp.]
MQINRSSGHRVRIGAATALGCALALVFGLSACAPSADSDEGPTSSPPAAKSSDGAAQGSASTKADSDSDGEGSDGDAGSAAAEGSASGSEGKPDAASDGGSWSEQDSEEDLPKTTQLPASFPGVDFVIPQGAVIDDVGERSGGGWFLVLRATSAEQADAQWRAVIDGSGFAVADEAKTPEGGVSARLTNGRLAVDALTLPQTGGGVLLSYDIAPAA